MISHSEVQKPNLKKQTNGGKKNTHPKFPRSIYCIKYILYKLLLFRRNKPELLLTLKITNWATVASLCYRFNRLWHCNAPIRVPGRRVIFKSHCMFVSYKELSHHCLHLSVITSCLLGVNTNLPHHLTCLTKSKPFFLIQWKKILTVLTFSAAHMQKEPNFQL